MTSPEPALDAAAQELTSGREDIQKKPSKSTQMHQQMARAASTNNVHGEKKGEKKVEDTKEPGSRPKLRAAFGWAWEQGWSPFGVLRGEIVGQYIERCVSYLWLFGG